LLRAQSQRLLQVAENHGVRFPGLAPQASVNRMGSAHRERPRCLAPHAVAHQMGGALGQEPQVGSAEPGVAEALDVGRSVVDGPPPQLCIDLRGPVPVVGNGPGRRGDRREPTGLNILLDTALGAAPVLDAGRLLPAPHGEATHDDNGRAPDLACESLFPIASSISKTTCLSSKNASPATSL
jgi:hypothetical protein